MDWLFGRKKSEGKVEEAREVNHIEDGFVLLPQMPNNSQMPHYPSLPNYNRPAPFQHSMTVHHQPHSHVTPSVNQSNKNHINPLDSIPFRLSSKLYSTGSQAIPADIARIRYILDNTRKSLESSEWNYDFRLERNVVNETNLINGL